MTSQVEIYNMALSNIGISETVASLEEKSKARATCSRFWDIARDTTLADFPWPFATRYATLADLGSPPRNWAYQYQYPTDCLRALYLTVPGMRVPPLALQPKFETSYGAGGQVILADEPAAELAYVVRVTDEGRFPPMFVSALSWKLASLIAMPMSAQRTIAESAAAGYVAMAQLAWAAAANESTEDLFIAPDYITGRNG
jgi:hypothetical protein